MRSAGLLALRVAIGIIFIYMGYGKLGPNHEATAAMMVGLGFGSGSAAAAYLLGLLEFVGGFMVLLGAYVGIAGVWLSIIMVVAILTVHRGGPVFGYFLPLSILGGLLALIGSGAGQHRLVKTECRCKICQGGKAGGACGDCCAGGKPEETKKAEPN